MPARRPGPFESSAQRLLRNLRRREAIRPGSLIVTLFGDAIAPRGGVVALGSLIAAGALFGVNERHVRTSVGRLAQDGWIEAERTGRVSFYRLSDSGRRRFVQATQRIYGEAPAQWDGHWTFIALPPGVTDRRDQVREEMMLLGFGQLQPGLFASPTRSAQDTLATLNELGVSDEVLVTRATTVGALADAKIARTAWNLAELGRRYREFVELFAPVAAAATRQRALPSDAAFMVRTLLIHEYRKVHLRDPLLPAILLPHDFPGRQASDLCRGLYAALFQAAEGFLSGSMRSAAGKLPAAAPDTYRRFGGLQPG